VFTNKQTPLFSFLALHLAAFLLGGEGNLTQEPLQAAQNVTHAFRVARGYRLLELVRLRFVHWS